MFPEDLMEGKKWQILFLTKRFGGGDNYTPIRGHPRLRKRHLPFSIGIRERNHWFMLMMETWKEIGITEIHPAWDALNDYFGRVSMKMINKMEIE